MYLGVAPDLDASPVHLRFIMTSTVQVHLCLIIMLYKCTQPRPNVHSNLCMYLGVALDLDASPVHLRFIMNSAVQVYSVHNQDQMYTVTCVCI